MVGVVFSLRGVISFLFPLLPWRHRRARNLPVSFPSLRHRCITGSGIGTRPSPCIGRYTPTIGGGILRRTVTWDATRNCFRCIVSRTPPVLPLRCLRRRWASDAFHLAFAHLTKHGPIRVPGVLPHTILPGALTLFRQGTTPFSRLTLWISSPT